MTNVYSNMSWSAWTADGAYAAHPRLVQSLILQLELGPTLACLPHQKKPVMFGFYSDFFTHVFRKKNLACLEY